MCTDPLVMPNREIFMDGRISSLNSNQQDESYPSENDNTPKIRKPYTITKQRERWTDEEHNKFLEAIKLYGRSWRRIEDHIGSKTSVQIRSHAQKFFSKVTKESESSNITMKAVDIPPPRPKRKPAHPYPRKFGSSSSKGGTTSKKLEKPSSPNLVEDESPRSILSASLYNNVGYSTSIAQTCGTSSDPSTSSSNRVSLESIQQEIGSQSQQHLAEEARETTAPSASDTLTFEGKSDVDTEVVSQGTSFQLFGKTVLVADSSNTSTSVTSTSVTQNEMTHQRSPPSQNEQEGSPKNFSDTTSKESSNGWSYEVPSMFYYMSSQQELIGASQVSWNPMSWWGCFGSPTFQLGQYPNMGLQRVSSNTEVQEVSEIKEATNSLKPTKSTNESQLKGFLPYKRCSSHRTVDTDEERESQRVRLCL